MLNKVQLIGNLGNDPELRSTGTGTPVGGFSLATTDGKDNTEWHKIVVWDKTAKNCAEFLRKGSRAYVEGRIQTRTWETKEGEKRYSTEVVATQVKFLSSRSETAQTGGQTTAARSTKETQTITSFDAPSEPSLDNIPF